MRLQLFTLTLKIKSNFGPLAGQYVISISSPYNRVWDIYFPEPQHFSWSSPARRLSSLDLYGPHLKQLHSLYFTTAILHHFSCFVFSPYATTFLIRILLLTIQNVSIETGLRDGPYGVRISWQTIEFSSPNRPDRFLGQNNFLFNGYPRFFSGVRQPGREIDPFTST